ncbi:Hypothetical protein SMAX5B_012205 [Scophthalmus maximus]|uniref:Uncharacterized protein n=1 Tax=Scophthalmus maximus TaxID=52904 RepID=A0A2U9AXW6_SCOMX|nr:Hypothetical protein SMAX5B_012205 [Scophthalmus maximus]
MRAHSHLVTRRGGPLGVQPARRDPEPSVGQDESNTTEKPRERLSAARVAAGEDARVSRVRLMSDEATVVLCA